MSITVCKWRINIPDETCLKIQVLALLGLSQAEEACARSMSKKSSPHPRKGSLFDSRQILPHYQINVE